MTATTTLSRAELTRLHERLLTWFGAAARDLPWRRGVTPWAVLVSEVMLQQTPVARVLPAYEEWLRRWPIPAALALEAPGEAVRAWGRLGYPRRALRLHAAATAMVARHGGEVPQSIDELVALPGVGSYTAAAVASFAFGDRQPVLDTNVRRVFARIASGEQFAPATLTVAERAQAEELMPSQGAHRWAAAAMELGALICTARSPHCHECPVVSLCRWRIAGYPAYEGARRATQSWDGTDRQCRGQLMAVLRDASGPVPKAELDLVWPEAMQRERALDGLVADGLIEPVDDERFTLPR